MLWFDERGNIDLMSTTDAEHGIALKGTIFSVTRRSRSDSRQLLTYLLSPLLSVSTDLTDVTLVSDDTY